MNTHINQQKSELTVSSMQITITHMDEYHVPIRSDSYKTYILPSSEGMYVYYSSSIHSDLNKVSGPIQIKLWENLNTSVDSTLEYDLYYKTIRMSDLKSTPFVEINNNTYKIISSDVTYINSLVPGKIEVSLRYLNNTYYIEQIIIFIPKAELHHIFTNIKQCILVNKTRSIALYAESM